MVKNRLTSPSQLKAKATVLQREMDGRIKHKMTAHRTQTYREVAPLEAGDEE